MNLLFIQQHLFGKKRLNFQLKCFKNHVNVQLYTLVPM